MNSVYAGLEVEYGASGGGRPNRAKSLRWEDEESEAETRFSGLARAL